MIVSLPSRHTPNMKISTESTIEESPTTPSLSSAKRGFIGIITPALRQ